MIYTKHCSACNTELPTENFAKKGKGLQAICRACRSIWFKDHYQKNKEYYINRSKESTNKTALRFREYKQTLSCYNCGYKDNPNILQFHHTNPEEKDENIAILARNNTWNKLQKEISKCIVLCPNCHMDLHDKEKRR